MCQRNSLYLHIVGGLLAVWSGDSPEVRMESNFFCC